MQKVQTGTFSRVSICRCPALETQCHAWRLPVAVAPQRDASTDYWPEFQVIKSEDVPKNAALLRTGPVHGQDRAAEV